jgi:hypothetical protein
MTIQSRLVRSLLTATAVTSMTLATNEPAAAVRPAVVEITTTERGRAMVETTAAQLSAKGHRTIAGSLRVWSLGSGTFVVADRMPDNLKTSVVTDAAGRTRVSARWNVSSRADGHLRATAAAASVSWSWLNQACFTVIQNTYGTLQPCYAMHKLTGESDPRDFYQLEQYGTLYARPGGKIYNGWMRGVRASSAAMSWIDWSPRGSLSGGCATTPISVKALGVGISASGIMCEHWDHFQGNPGDYKQQWSCGCIFPFGQPFPNGRELDLMQAVSVANGRSVAWNLYAGFTAIQA